MQHEEVAVKYRDLFEKFKQVLMAEMRKEQTEAPLVMALNAFRGFLDEFMKQHAGRRREKKDDRGKAEKPVKKDKQKKDTLVSVMLSKETEKNWRYNDDRDNTTTTTHNNDYDIYDDNDDNYNIKISFI